MGWKCCVPACRSGYLEIGSRSKKAKIEKAEEVNVSTGNKLSFHAFPEDSNLLKIWLKRIPRDFIPTKSSRVCSLHFDETDFENISKDCNKSRKRKRNFEELKIRILKNSAVPSKFPNCPSYLSSKHETLRLSSASAASRLTLQNERMQENEDIFLKSEAFETLEELNNMLHRISLPNGYYAIKSVIDSIIFVYMPTVENSAPRILCSVRLTKALEIEAFVKDARIKETFYHHTLTTKNKVSCVTELCNLLAYIKSLVDTNDTKKASLLSVATEILEQFIFENQNDDNLKLYLFIKEQLKLSSSSKYARHYSTETITLSFFWYIRSHSLYRNLRNLFILPSVRRLQMLSSGTSANPYDVDLTYLKTRCANLSENQKVVNLMFDEVYTACRVECVGGNLIGLTEDGEQCKTILVFMVQSLEKKYKDVVKLVPLSSFSVAILEKHFNAVMNAVSSLLFVISVTSDNHLVNRNFFIKLCGGRIKPSIPHPIMPNRQLYLLFDSTHNYKNAFNNWCNKKVFAFPSGFGDILECGEVANFNHIKALFAKEEAKPLKIAHLLTQNTLNPNNIARTSVRHAVAVFSETTVRALQFYNEPGWYSTSKFVLFILELWKILNVKSSTKGVHKRDDIQKPIFKSDSSSLIHLRKSADFIESWKTSTSCGFTAETSLAWCQTLRAVADLCDDLLQNFGFQYVLLGKLLSDPIEARFGMYRQMNGANYFMSLRQVLDSEKKIKVLNKLKDLEDVFFETEKEFPDSILDHDSELENIVDWFLIKIQTDNVLEEDFLIHDDENIIFYVAGAIGRGISRSNKCSSCKDMLLEKRTIDLEFEELELLQKLPPDNNNVRQLFQMANRDGLSAPTSYMFTVCVLGYCVYQKISQNNEMFKKFLTCNSQCRLFANILEKLCGKVDVLKMLTAVKCINNHVFFSRISSKLFHCFVKNLLKKLNLKDLDILSKTATRSQRKIAKFNGFNN